MATIPSAHVTISAEAGALAGGTGYCVVPMCVATNADSTPRVFASWKALYAQHGYAPGVDYVAHHIEATRQPVIVVPLPIVTAGAIGRQNNTGVTGTSVISVAAGSNGVLDEVDAVVTVTTAGTVGTDQMSFTLSLDGGRTEKTIRLGTATSYTIPYVGLVLSFTVGTLAVDDVYTFTTTAPLWDGTGIASIRGALAAQQKPARSWMLIGDVANSTIAGNVTTAVNGYETTNSRFAYARINVFDRLPLGTLAHVTKTMKGAPTLTFAEVGGTGDTITRSTGSWITDGFAVGDVVTVAGSVSNNGVTGPIAALSATVLTFDTTDLAAEGPVSNVTVTGSAGLTFAEVGGTGDTITRSAGSWLADGFRVGDTVTITGTALNNVTGAIAALTATVLTFGSTDLQAEVIGSHNVTSVKGETMAAWISRVDAAFASVTAQKRIDIAVGRARKESPIHGSELRRPASWLASIREYTKDVHIPCWRVKDGPLDGWSLEDADGNIVEYNEATDGGALAGRFTCLRTWDGPGTYVAMSLTRDTEGSVLSYTHNMAVANIACTIVQAATVRMVGEVVVVDDDGHASPAALQRLAEKVNSDLAIALRSEKVPGEGPRASKAVWTPSTDDDLSVVDATLTGVADLTVNGTIVHVETSVKVR